MLSTSENLDYATLASQQPLEKVNPSYFWTARELTGMDSLALFSLANTMRSWRVRDCRVERVNSSSATTSGVLNVCWCGRKGDGLLLGEELPHALGYLGLCGGWCGNTINSWNWRREMEIEAGRYGMACIRSKLFPRWLAAGSRRQRHGLWIWEWVDRI